MDLWIVVAILIFTMLLDRLLLDRWQAVCRVCPDAMVSWAKAELQVRTAVLVRAELLDKVVLVLLVLAFLVLLAHNLRVALVLVLDMQQPREAQVVLAKLVLAQVQVCIVIVAVMFHQDLPDIGAEFLENRVLVVA